MQCIPCTTAALVATLRYKITLLGTDTCARLGFRSLKIVLHNLSPNSRLDTLDGIGGVYDACILCTSGHLGSHLALFKNNAAWHSLQAPLLRSHIVAAIVCR